MNVKKGMKRCLVGWVVVALSAAGAVVWLWAGQWLHGAWSGGRWECDGGNFRCTIGDEESIRWHDEMRPLYDHFGDRPLPPGERPWTWQRGFTPPHPSHAHQFTLPLWAGVAGLVACAAACLTPWRAGRAGKRRLLAGGAMCPAGLALWGVWVWSGWGSSRLNLAPLWVTFDSGAAIVEFDLGEKSVGGFARAWGATHQQSATPAGVRFGTSGAWELWPFARFGEGVVAPIWVLALGVLGCGAAVGRWGLDAWRRSAEGRCEGCGYDVRGLGLGAVCPECGKGGKGVKAT